MKHSLFKSKPVINLSLRNEQQRIEEIKLDRMMTKVNAFFCIIKLP